MRRSPAALATVAALACAGCPEDGDRARETPPAARQVQGSLDLQRGRAGGRGADRYLVRAGAANVIVNGRVKPAAASVALVDTGGRRTARVNVAGDGTFSALLPGLPPRRTVTFRLTATSGRAHAWRAEIVASRRTGAAARQPRRPAVAVPARDLTPPLAVILLRIGDRVVSSVSPVRDDTDEPIRLERPSFALTALIRDRDGGTGRIRASLSYRRICLDSATRRRTSRRRTLHFPPSEIARVKLPPGATAPSERRRRARVRLAPGPDCLVRGKMWADATNASGLESFSDQIRFVLDPGGDR